MGRVFAGRDPVSNAEVAVKVLRVGAGPHTKNLFCREARLMGAITSEHVARVLQFCEDADEGAAIVMERVRGEDLSRRIDREAPLAIDEVRAIASEVARALSAVHAAGIVHSDVKPENVIVSGRGAEARVKLVDFGVARRLGEDEPALATDKLPSGTPSSMSPEQIADPEAPETSWDVWGLACLTFTCLTGRIPHEGRTLSEILLAAIMGTRPLASSLRADLPCAVDAVFERAFASKASERYATPTDFADALDAALGG